MVLPTSSSLGRMRANTHTVYLLFQPYSLSHHLELCFVVRVCFSLFYSPIWYVLLSRK